MNEDRRDENMVSPSPNESQKGPHLHIGRRKLKSIFAMFLGFCFWQLLRLLVPGKMSRLHHIFFKRCMNQISSGLIMKRTNPYVERPFQHRGKHSGGFLDGSLI